MCGKRGQLVDELERLAERLWRCDETEAAPAHWAVDVSSLLERVYRNAVEAAPREKFDDLALLEADRAKEARRLTVFGGGSPKRIGGCAADGDAAELPAHGDPLFERYQLLMLRHVAALEFGKLALMLFEPSLEGGAIGFKEPDLVAAKKLAEPLKWFAARIDKLEDGDDGINVHRLIAEYKNRREVAKNAGDYTT